MSEQSKKNFFDINLLKPTIIILGSWIYFILEELLSDFGLDKIRHTRGDLLSSRLWNLVMEGNEPIVIQNEEGVTQQGSLEI